MMKAVPTYEDEVLGVVAYEFFSQDQAASERKLRRRLRDKKLGAYDPQRIERLRAFKNHVRNEIGLAGGSRFFRGQNGRFVEMEDWDRDGFAQFLAERYPDIPADAIRGFLPFAILIYYLK